METRELNIRITLDRRSVFLLMVLFFVSWHPGNIGSETLTLTTYYPAPYGGYARLLTTGDTVLARDAASGVGIGNLTPPFVDKLTVQGTGTAISAVDGDVRNRFFSASATGFGYVGTSTNHGLSVRTNDTDRMVVTPAGEVQVINDLRVSGTIRGSCVTRPYTPTGQTNCTFFGADYTLIGYYPDGGKRVMGFLPANAWSMESGVGTYVSFGHDWGGELLCCRISVN